MNAAARAVLGTLRAFPMGPRGFLRGFSRTPVLSESRAAVQKSTPVKPFSALCPAMSGFGFSGISGVSRSGCFGLSFGRISTGLSTGLSIAVVPSISSSALLTTRRGFAFNRGGWIDKKKHALKHRGEIMRRKKLKHKNHAEILNRFLLTRFGWCHRSISKNGSDRRLKTPKFKHRTRKIVWVQRSYTRILTRCAPGYRLLRRDAIIDHNPNYKPARAVTGSHFG